jgi:uncharacterized membrane protein YvlD (DUF360 family)
LKRTFIVFIGNVIGFYIAALILGVKITYFDDIILFVLFISIINALLWPILTRILMPFLAITFGIGSLILNGLIIQFFAPLFDFDIGGIAIIVFPIVMASVTTILSSIITVDEESTYYRSVIRDARKKRPKEAKDYPGLIIIEIDGLAYNVLNEALEEGLMPTVQGLIESGSHTLRPWETDLSSQTGASQAGILHGNNEGITAFRWIEKSNDNQMMQCSGPSKVKTLEERISDGNGLLCENGASRSNLFSGDTDNVIFTLSKITDTSKLYNRAWYSVFSNPSNFARIVFLLLADMLHEIYSQIYHKIFDIQPRINRGIVYIPTRAVTNVFMREINTSTIIGDMMVGEVDIVYSTYLGYDEIAHHSGVRDNDAWYALKGMDLQIRFMMNATKYTPRPYYFVIQSDHGQTNGATFSQRNGQTFEDLVKSLLPNNMSMYANMSSNEDHYTEGALPSFTHKHEIEEDEETDKDVIVLASGNLAMIYLTNWSYRLTYEEMTSMFPELIPGIINNPYIGFIVVKSSENGDMAIGKNGTYYLDSDRIEGENPLDGFGKNIARHIKRNVSFEHTPDILVNSFYDEEADEVCAFEELVGSHGGAGGDQTKPFILYPSDWDVSEDIIGAESIYQILKENNEKLKNS